LLTVTHRLQAAVDADHIFVIEKGRISEHGSFPPRRTIIQQGDPADRFYVIARGAVSVIRSDDADGKRRVAVLKDGDHFGEIALLEGGPRTSTVTTLQPTVLLTLSRERFRQVLDRDPALLERISQLARSRRAALVDAA
jgi:ATP-binding cassette subfamily B protein